MLTTQFALSAGIARPEKARLIPGCDAYGIGLTEAELIESNRHNGSLQMYNGGTMWKVEKGRNGRWTRFTRLYDVNRLGNRIGAA